MHTLRTLIQRQGYCVRRLLDSFLSMSQEEIATYVTVEDFQFYLQKANERISSSYSRLHFGYYKAAPIDRELSRLHVEKLSACD